MHKKTLLENGSMDLVIRLVKKVLCFGTYEGKCLYDYITASSRQVVDSDRWAIREVISQSLRFLKAMGLDTYDDIIVHSDPDKTIPVKRESAAARA